MAQAIAHFVQRHVGWGGGVMPAILMYHSVSPYSSDPYQVTVGPARFRQQMAWLRARGLRGVGVASRGSGITPFARPWEGRPLAAVSGLIPPWRNQASTRRRPCRRRRSRHRLPRPTGGAAWYGRAG